MIDYNISVWLKFSISAKSMILLWLFSYVYANGQTNYLSPVSIKSDTLYIDQYSNTRTEKVFVGDMSIKRFRLATSDFYNTFYSNFDLREFRIYLLKNEYAELIDTTYATEEELAIYRRNLRKKQNTPSWIKRTFNSSIRYIKENYQFLLKLLAGLGIFAWLFKIFYKKIFIEKQLKLLLIGEPSSGKTALYKTLANENVTKDEILNLTPTRQMNTVRPKKIPHGKYEIIPEIRDTPGSDYSGIWENIFGRRKNAIILLLSPVQANYFKKVNGSWERQPFNSNEVDNKFLNIQFGILKAYLGGLSAKSVRRKKPKIVVLFINKFDLMSDFSPEDSTSRSKEREFRAFFQEHIEFAESQSSKAGIRCKVIVGSTIRKWGTKEALDSIKNELYNN